MSDNVALNNEQINAIVTAAYDLANTIGMWTAAPDSDSDAEILSALALVQEEMKALFAACPDLDRPHTAEEVQVIVERSLLLMTKFSFSFSSVDRIPQLFREQVKKLYWALNDAGLIDPKEA
ncbi:MAG TPA: hypothetical protein VEK08_21885 [Planctomycetota bacterium]|nr:hypothetical protein [Planctomycetota bacterium]